MILTDVRQAYEYDRDGNRTNKVTGLKVTVALEKNGYDTLTVTVANPEDRLSSLLEKSDGPIYVDFDEFSAHIYTMRGKTDVSAKAKDVRIITDDLLDIEVG